MVSKTPLQKPMHTQHTVDILDNSLNYSARGNPLETYNRGTITQVVQLCITKERSK
jgi:hypothetical protein